MPLLNPNASCAANVSMVSGVSPTCVANSSGLRRAARQLCFGSAVPSNPAPGLFGRQSVAELLVIFRFYQ